MILQNISGEILIPISLIFARIGSAFYLFPGLSSKYILMQARLSLAILVSITLFPILKEYIPEMNSGEFLIFLIMEVLFGLIISMAAKICFSALDIVGSIISMQSGLAAANFFDPNHGEQVSLISNFLFMIGYMMIFATDTHYLLLEAIVDSYQIFKVGGFVDLGDVSHYVSNAMNQAFILGFKLASPFIAISIGFLISNGVLSRLMPNLQVFFVVTPVQIFVMFIILFITINYIMAKFIEAFRATVQFGGVM